MPFVKLKLPCKAAAVTAAYQIDINDFLIPVDATAGALIITLPTAASCYAAGIGQVFVVKKVDASVNTVTLDGNGAELIEGAANQVLALQWAGLSVISNGVGWLIVP